MAKNKKKLRKKLRHELLQKAHQQSAAQSAIAATEEQATSSPGASSASPQQASQKTQKITHQAIVVNPHIKKDIMLALALSTLTVVAIIGGRMLNNEYGWVIQAANWLYGIF